jgi:hypothetical protein
MRVSSDRVSARERQRQSGQGGGREGGQTCVIGDLQKETEDGADKSLALLLLQSEVFDALDESNAAGAKRMRERG